jgi:hypothetical protein
MELYGSIGGGFYSFAAPRDMIGATLKGAIDADE